MNGPGNLLSYDSPNIYGLFPSGALGKPEAQARREGGAGALPSCYPRQSERRQNPMVAQTRIDEMRNADIRAADKNTLADMSDFEFDNSLSQEERAKRIFEKTKSPYLFRLGDTAVKLEFAESGPTMQDLMASLLLRHKSGL
jgi:hypothetical protein